MPSISEAYLSHPVHLPNKHLLDFHNVRELPESHAWAAPPLDEAPPQPTEDVPVVDLNDQNALKLIGHACKTWGVFQVISHGVPATLLENTERAGKTLFSLPLQQKLKAARSPEGISGYGIARISSFFDKLMWSEGFTIFGSPLHHALQLWPHHRQSTKFCNVVEEYEKAMKNLAARLMLLMLGSLDITKEDIGWGGSCSAIQLNSYPACPDPDRAMGLAAHTDSTLLTILYQSNTSGLQVRREGITGWVTVPPLPGALVVHVGDLLHILSNGLYPSVLHRAMVNRTRHRLSVAYLYGPPSSVRIEPLPKLVGPGRPPMYRPVTWSEYLGSKAKHFDKALSAIRICSPPLDGLIDVNDHNGSVQVG